MAQLEHIEAIEKRLWSAADTLRANSNFAANEFFMPVMGLIFLRHAYSRYLAVKDEVVKSLPSRGGKTGEDEAAAWLEERFPDGKYRDVEGLVKAVTREEIAANDWSLTPGRYVGVAETDDNDEDFAEKFASLHEELSKLNAEAATLAKKIDADFKELMGGEGA